MMDENGKDLWLKISFHCPEIILEPVADILGVLSGSGVEQSPVVRGRSTVSAFFRLGRATEEEIRQRVEEEMGQLFSLYELPAPPLRCETVRDEDWATSWQRFFKPFAIIPGLVIRPSWESYEPREGEQVLELDPGRAFGTGQHASTRLALGLIDQCCRDKVPATLLDVGTGTGILAMAGILFGMEKGVAVDNDDDAVEAARHNIAVNEMTNRIDCSATDLARIKGRFDLVCANIVHDVLVDLAPELVQRVAPGGSLVLAGILAGGQEENLTRVFQEQGLGLTRAAQEDEWVGLLFYSETAT